MNDLSRLTRHLLDSVAEIVVAPVAKVGADHVEIRARLAEYRAGAAAGANVAGLLGEAHEAAVDHARNRYQDWLGHPRLGHVPWIEEGEAADVSLRDAAVRVQESGTPANLLQLWLAIVRVCAITAVMGENCIYSEPRRSRAKKVGGARRGPKGRARAVRLSDVPDALWSLIDRIVFGDGADRGIALEELEVLRGSALDVGSIVTKIAQLARDPSSEAINRLSTEIRRVRFVAGDQPDAGQAEVVPAMTVSLVPVSATPAHIEEVQGGKPAGDLPQLATAGEMDGEAAKARAMLVAFFTRNEWALSEQAGRIVSTAGKAQIVEAFARYGDRPDIQAELRNILKRKTA